MDKTLERILTLLSERKLLSIAGPSATGKTTLAQMLVGEFLTREEPYEECALWGQVSEVFSLVRFKMIFEENPERAHYLLENLYINPEGAPCSSYDHQFQVLQHLIHHEEALPPSLSCIVIDNISHHLRYQISQEDSPMGKSHIQNEFYNRQLFPLIMFCSRLEIALILIHEATYDPSLGQIKPFFSKLYERIRHPIIFLSGDRFRSQKTMEVKDNGELFSVGYSITSHGLLFKE